MKALLETLVAFFDDPWKIPATGRRGQSFKRRKSASYDWNGTTQLVCVDELVVEEVENIPLVEEEVVLLRTKRETYYSPSYVLKR